MASRRKFVQANGQLAFLRADDTPLPADDVADVPVLELLKHAFGQLVPLQHQLDGAAAVLQEDEGNLAHHAFGHHAPGDGENLIDGFERRCVRVTETLMEFGGCGVLAEVVRVRLPRFAQSRQLGPPLGDEAVLVLFGVACRCSCYPYRSLCQIMMPLLGGRPPTVPA